MRLVAKFPYSGGNVVLYREPGPPFMHEYFMGWRLLHPENLGFDNPRHYIVTTKKIKGSRRISLDGACRSGLRRVFGRVLKHVYVKPFTLVRKRRRV